VTAYYDPKKSKMTVTEGLRAIAKFLALVIVVGVLIWTWNEWQESAWAFHKRMATVQAKGWQAGQYKLCVTALRKELKYSLLLDCDESWDHDPKFFNVRFWGPIQKQEQQREITMHWKCKKDAQDEPAITCESEEQ
jgi:hypothetical protein